MANHRDLEERVREIGKEIYSSCQGETPSAFDKTRWIGKALDWAMQDDSFKVRLFRFIDVLPSLQSDDLIVSILKEYFSDDKEAHGIMKWGIRGLPAKGFLPSLAGRAIRQNVEAFALQFIAGKNPAHSIEKVKYLRQEGYAFGIDILGEVVLSENEEKNYVQKYLDLITELSGIDDNWPENTILDIDDKGPVPSLNISLKVSSLYSQLDPANWEGSIKNVKSNLRTVFTKAIDNGCSVTVDMENYHIKDLTLAIFKSILDEEDFSEFAHTGIALQTYLHDARKDLTDLISWAKNRERRISVRLVKGAYWDYETAVCSQKGWPVPVFLNKEETDRNFEELTKLMLENGDVIRPAIASHNMRSISHAIATAESLKVPKEGYEFQMLYGMAEPLRKAVRDMGYRVRIYTPVGDLIPGMSYLVRRLLENTSNESFLRKSFAEKKSFDDLIREPEAPDVKTGPDISEGFINEPPLDFSKAVNRDKMKQALEKARKAFNTKYPLYIGNKELWSKEEIRSLNPSNPDEVIGSVSAATTEHAEKALEIARDSWENWRQVSPEKRASYLFAAAEEIKRRRFELSALQVYEVGKSWQEADGDIIEAIDYLHFYGHEMIRLGSARQLGKFAGELNSYLYEPKGVGVVISPWNFPLAISTGMISAGIVTGNCMLYKPSGLAPVTGWKLVDIFRNTGLPEGVLQFINGKGSNVGEHLVSHPGVDFIAFTGSREVGLKIIEHGGRTAPGQRTIKKVIVEMGGKNAIIIDETADMDDAVKGVVGSALGYQGQKCSACSRVIIVGDVYHDFCSRLKDAMASISVGPPEDPANFMGPLIDQSALDKVEKYCLAGKDSGTELLYGHLEGKGYFAGPSIYADVNPDSTIAREEIFGPVISIMKADSMASAIQIANNTSYALTGGIFSRSPANIEMAMNNLRVGNFYINRQITGAIVGRQPFGGFAMSGVGSKAGGSDYLVQFMNPKSISENTMRKGFSPSID